MCIRDRSKGAAARRRDTYAQSTGARGCPQDHRGPSLRRHAVAARALRAAADQRPYLKIAVANSRRPQRRS
eukprot:4326644-Alexandrium_andersonii.AAC.1